MPVSMALAGPVGEALVMTAAGLAVAIPAVEVHISDVDAREAFRQVSYAGMACIKTYKGLGFEAYRQAILFLAAYLKQEEKGGL